jgi:hypothetical protein
MQQLGDDAVELGALEGDVVWKDPVGGHGNRVQADGAAGGRTPAHAAPVVDHGDAGGGPGDVRHVQHVLLCAGRHRDPVCEQGAHGVALDPAHPRPLHIKVK